MAVGVATSGQRTGNTSGRGAAPHALPGSVVVWCGAGRGRVEGALLNRGPRHRPPTESPDTCPYARPPYVGVGLFYPPYTCGPL